MRLVKHFMRLRSNCIPSKEAESKRKRKRAGKGKAKLVLQAKEKELYDISNGGKSKILEQTLQNQMERDPQL